MKNFIFLMLCIVATNCYAQQIPAKAKTAFISHFPKATSVKWGKDGKDSYEANFMENGKEMSANFATNGAWQETETEMAGNDLPKNILEAVKKKYPNGKIVGGAKIELANKEIHYEADVKNGKKKMEVILSEKGEFIK